MNGPLPALAGLLTALVAVQDPRPPNVYDFCDGLYGELRDTYPGDPVSVTEARSRRSMHITRVRKLAVLLDEYTEREYHERTVDEITTRMGAHLCQVAFLHGWIERAKR